MSSPLTVKRNDYNAKPKRRDVPTPQGVARFIASLFPCEQMVFDPCVGGGPLLAPFSCPTAGIDLKTGDDFLSWENPEQLAPSLVVCNPPFNLGGGRKLGSAVFFGRIVELWPTAKIVLFVPMGFRLNQRLVSKRWRWLRDSAPAITSIISLPLNIFEGVEFHAEILVFNAPELEAHYFLPENSLQ